MPPPVIPDLLLADGTSIPQIGFGTYKIDNDHVVAAIDAAVALGYRAIDTAAFYKNETGVGDGIRLASAPRSDLYITTKVWTTELGATKSRASVMASLDRLGLDHVDLLLIHWPAPKLDLYVETWKTFIELQAEGKTTSIGVSNFTEEHLSRIIDDTGVAPVVNQVELHPWEPQTALRKFHAAHGIATTAWSPLARNQVLSEPVIVRLASEYEVSPAQIVLRWHLQLGNIVIPKSTHVERIAQNIDLFGFELDDAAMAAIATLENGHRTGNHPNDRN